MRRIDVVLPDYNTTRNARDVSLNTNVVTHQDSKECKKTTALFPSLFCSFFFRG